MKATGWQGYSLAEVVPLLERRPLAPLAGPGEQIGDLADRGLADWIPAGRRRRRNSIWMSGAR